MTSSSVNVEICVEARDLRSTGRSVGAALRGGAATVELCAEMHLHGTTPAPEMIGAARIALGEHGGLMAMIRTRGGDFVYSASEIDTMLRQIPVARRAGADGVVVGVLSDGEIDVENLRRLIDAARGHELAVTFHRAFDAVADSARALDHLIALGVDRVLTSGVPWGGHGSAVDGIERLGKLIQQAGSSIEVVIGGGISAGCVGAVLKRLPAHPGPLSVHAYSSVLRSGLTDEEAVRELVRAVAAGDVTP